MNNSYSKIYDIVSKGVLTEYSIFKPIGDKVYNKVNVVINRTVNVEVGESVRRAIVNLVDPM